jgi:hypothetical protein
LESLRAKSKRLYLDDGPVALFYTIKQMQAKGYHEFVEWSLKELERLYRLEEEIKWGENPI